MDDRLNLKIFILGELFTNSYIIFNKETKRGFIVDIPQDIDRIKKFIENNKLDILFIVLTHGHFDHIGGIDNLNYPFYIHKKDAPLLKNPYMNGSSLFGVSISIEREPIVLEKETKMEFENYSIEIIHTPGHTPGSISLRLNNWLFSGDTLFLNGIGRTDTPLGSQNLLIKSIKEKIFSLPLNTLVYPGHGEPTTIENEKKFNPFFV